MMNYLVSIFREEEDKHPYGPTHIVPGSHRYGRVVDPEFAEKHAVPACGKAGTAVLINSNLWHRGCANTSDRTRDTLQNVE